MYGKKSDPTLLNRLETMKNNISKEKLTQQQKDDFLKKWICDGALRNNFDFSAY